MAARMQSMTKIALPTNALVRNGLILGAFALVASLLLSLTYTLTAPRIAEQKAAQQLKLLNQIIDPTSHDNPLHTDCLVLEATQAISAEPLVIYRARKQNQPVALALQVVTPEGYSGKIKLLVGVDTQGQVTGVRTLTHKETPGLGDKIELRVSDWVLDFNGLHYQPAQAASWAVKKDGGQFDQFSGATITPRAYVNAVKDALAFAQQHQTQLFAQPANCQGQNQ